MNYNYILNPYTNNIINKDNLLFKYLIHKYIQQNGGSTIISSETKILPIPNIGINAQIEYHIIGNPNAENKIFIFHEMGLTYTRWKDSLSMLVTSMPNYVFILPNRPGYGNSKGFFTNKGHILTQGEIGKLTHYISSSAFLPTPVERNETKYLNTEEYVGFSYKLFSYIIDFISREEGWNTFYVAGYSSGGPCALACAAHLGPTRVLGTLVVSGDTDYRRIKFEEGLDKTKLGSYINSLLLGDVLHGLHLVVDTFSSKQSADGYSIDFFLERSGWDFKIENIEVPIIFAHGSKDNEGMIYGTRWAKEKNPEYILPIQLENLNHVGINKPSITTDLSRLLVKLISTKADEKDFFNELKLKLKNDLLSLTEDYLAMLSIQPAHMILKIIDY